MIIARLGCGWLRVSPLPTPERRRITRRPRAPAAITFKIVRETSLALPRGRHRVCALRRIEDRNAELGPSSGMEAYRLSANQCRKREAVLVWCNLRGTDRLPGSSGDGVGDEYAVADRGTLGGLNAEPNAAAAGRRDPVRETMRIEETQLADRRARDSMRGEGRTDLTVMRRSVQQIVVIVINGEHLDGC